MIQLLMYILLGTAAGVLSGLLGIGGGIIMVPALVLLFGLSQHQAQGTSLAVMIPPVGLLAAMVYYKKGFINIPVAVLVAAGFLIGGLIGAKVSINIPEETLKRGFGFILLLTSVKMMFF